MTKWRLLGLAAVVAVLATPAIGAETRIETSNKKWAQMDACTKESFQKFPDYTTEGASKRDAYVRDCLRTHRLTPRNDLAQPRPPQQ